MSLEILCYYYYNECPAYNSPCLSLEDRRRRDRRTPRIAIRRYNLSPFLYMFRSGKEQALLNCCGVNHEVFKELLDLFQLVYDTYTYDVNTGIIQKLKIKGKKRELDATGCLGLLLYWFRTRGSAARGIGWAFGVTATSMYKWLRFARRILLSVLQTNPLAEVRLPTLDEVEIYVEALATKYPVLGEHRVWGACDGLKLPFEKSTNWFEQNKFYNGWTSGTFVNSVLLFAPDGKVRAAVLNAPGCWHDSTIADYGLYDKMEKVFDDFNARVVVDSAFHRQTKDYLIKSGQTDPDTLEDLVLNNAATSCRQLSEWGMRQIQGGFPRLKDNMSLEYAGERKVILNLAILLYNYQTTRVQINTILNTFMSETKGFFSYGLIPTTTANDFFFDNNNDER